MSTLTDWGHTIVTCPGCDGRMDARSRLCKSCTARQQTRQRSDRVPAGPFVAWLQQTLTRYDGNTEKAAEACGMSAHTFCRYLRGHLYNGDGTVGLGMVDRYLVNEGSTPLELVYPFEEYGL